MSSSGPTVFRRLCLAKGAKAAFLSILVSTSLFTTATWAAAQVVAAGLAGPTKVDVTPSGNVLVTERGTGVNDGRLTRVDRTGNVQPLISGLPSGIETTGQPQGPCGVVVQTSSVVAITIGEGHNLIFDAPPKQVPNPVGANSPIYSSVLALTFNQSIDQISDGFTLTPADHTTLADGYTVSLKNGSGGKAWIRLVVDLKDFRPDPITNVRGSNPFMMIEASDGSGKLLVDSGQNSVVQVDPFQWPKTLLRFPPIQNPPGGPPFSDAVPTSIRHFGGNRYLVSLLTGVPFRPGAASIQVLNIKTRTQTTLISGLTSVTDVLRVGTDIYVLEISTDLNVGAPGQLLRFSSPSATPVVVAAGLIGGSGMTYSPKDRAIYVAEIFTGRIIRVPL
jgi:hypothetical protein